MGYIAENIKWAVDSSGKAGSIVYQIRHGVHYALDSNNEASRLANGREVTADDVVFGLKRAATDPNAFIYKSNPNLRTAEIAKTGSSEVTVKVPLEALVQALSRFGESTNVAPSEVVQKYGDMSNWKNSVGTGPFILSDYVTGSSITLVRNRNYWMTDPIGPGKGNQLPYLGGVKLFIISDASTQLAALRTGKIDQVGGQMTGVMGLTWEDASSMQKTTPELMHMEGEYGAMAATYFNTTKAPFNDVRVRRAMMMATDLESIRQSLNHGLGQILTFPFEYTETYADLFLGIDDPQCPPTVKELYTYNPDKSKALLKDAGLPNGFKTSILITSNDADYFSVMKGMWAKVGIDLTLDIRDAAVVQNLMTNKDYQMATGGRAPVGIFYLLSNLTGQATTNGSLVDDPVINTGIAEVRQACITDMRAGMRRFKEMMKYTLDQAYAIPRPSYRLTIFFWPWLKNYTGETCVGMESGNAWAQWIWYDQELKRSMGH
jgi:peptide/nickel transport system substrate-binding protein